MDWTGCDLKAEHHPQCTFGLAVVKQMSIEEAAKTYPWQGDYGTGTAHISGEPVNPESGTLCPHCGHSHPGAYCGREVDALLGQPESGYTWVPREEGEGLGLPALPEGATGWKVYPASAVNRIAPKQTPGGREYSEVEQRYFDADTNPASAYELGRHDGALAEREAIAEMLDGEATRRYDEAKNGYDIQFCNALRQAAKQVREQK